MWFRVLLVAQILWESCVCLDDDPNSTLIYTPPSCTFVSEIDNSTLAHEVNKRCMNLIASKIVSKSGVKGVNVHNRKCGVHNATTIDSIHQSDICLSQYDDPIGVSFIHVLNIDNELYFTDYRDVKKKRFMKKRSDLEDLWNSKVLKHMPDKGFERATVLRIVNASNLINVFALLQFAQADAKTIYEGIFNANMATNGSFGQFRVNVSASGITDPWNCENLTSIIQRVPRVLWEASEGTQLASNPIPIGQTVDFACPEGLQLSEDIDGFDKYDNKFSLVCTVLTRYDEPEAWPQCVPRCGDTIEPPASSLMNKVPLNTYVPAGKFAHYVCNDTSLGVERGGSEFLKVLCMNDATYDYPPNGTWPVCAKRTTTMSPVLPIGIKSFLDKQTSQLQYRVRQTGWTAEFEPTEGKNWVILVVLPYFLGLTILILFCCIISRKDSPLYKMCSDSEEFKKI
ncbi:uncharacterized protein LOC131880270 [Tigriopus californicus]|uniref:uncharacterized protein LOC131880270 n=1 Tax=Tigriopus californicus TaxID=6832 RepID=UPI0027DA9A12|nr:uncharacterized protein LOC131880270 [Tigriopus californicus]